MKNIEWATRTWNPLTGCKRGCEWTAPDGKVVGCYAKAISDRFHHQPDFCEAVWHPDRLKQPSLYKKQQRVFVCSMADLFGDWVETEHINEVLRVIRYNPRHTFLLLTKNPKRLQEFTFPNNAHVGVSIGQHCQNISYYEAAVKWLSFEPVLPGTIPFSPKVQFADIGFKWVVIGALSAGAKKYQPLLKDVENILLSSLGLPVFMKDNLDCDALGITRRQELPC